jgi:hypothetical protein
MGYKEKIMFWLFNIKKKIYEFASPFYCRSRQFFVVFVVLRVYCFAWLAKIQQQKNSEDQAGQGTKRFMCMNVECPDKKTEKIEGNCDE